MKARPGLIFQKTSPGLILLVLLSAGLAAPQAPARFRSTTQFVTVDVVVTGKDDAPVTDLTKDDFEITENGNPQKISEFGFVSVPLANRPFEIK